MAMSVNSMSGLASDNPHVTPDNYVNINNVWER